MFLEARQPEEAEDSLTRCLGIREAKLGRGYIKVACALHQLHVLYREVGLAQEVEECWGRCPDLGGQTGSTEPAEDENVHELGLYVPKAERLTEAGNFLRYCLEIE